MVELGLLLFMPLHAAGEAVEPALSAQTNVTRVTRKALAHVCPKGKHRGGRSFPTEAACFDAAKEAEDEFQKNLQEFVRRSEERRD